MKQLKFLFTVLISAVLTIFVVTACNSQTPDTASSPAASPSGNSSGETLVMATSADYKPYEFIETATGSEDIIGFDVDVAKHITQELGYGLEIRNIDFNGLIPALQAGRADFVMAGMTPTDERKQNADFSDIYFRAQNTIVSKKDSGFTTPETLNGKKVGVQLGSIQEGAAKKIQGANVVQLNRINEIIQEIKAGRIDAAIVEDTVAKGYVDSNPDLAFTPIPTDEGGSAIAFPKGSNLVADFNREIAELKSSGRLEEFVKKWFADYQSPTSASDAASPSAGASPSPEASPGAATSPAAQ